MIKIDRRTGWAERVPKRVARWVQTIRRRAHRFHTMDSRVSWWSNSRSWLLYLPGNWPTYPWRKFRVSSCGTWMRLQHPASKQVVYYSLGPELSDLLW